MGRNENAFAKLSQDTDSKPHFTGKGHLHLWTYGGWLSRCVLSLQSPLGCQCRGGFAFSLQERKTPYSSVLKELRLVDATEKTADTAQRSPHISGGQRGQDLVL